MKAKKKGVRKTIAKSEAGSWAPKDKSVSVVSKPKPKGFVLELAQTEAKPFGEWISSNLDDLYEAFRKSKTEN
jgi:ParB family chromosome partitioning protein